MDDRLELAARLTKLGKINEARLLLKTLLDEDHHNLAAWKLYAQTWPEPSDRQRIMQLCLKFNPAESGVQSAAPASHPPRPEPNPSPAVEAPEPSAPEAGAQKAPAPVAGKKAAAALPNPSPIAQAPKPATRDVNHEESSVTDSGRGLAPAQPPSKASRSNVNWEKVAAFVPSAIPTPSVPAPRPAIAELQEHKPAALAPSMSSAPIRRSGARLWFLTAGLVGIMLVVLIVVYAVSSLVPKNPGAYRHTQPVEYYLYVPKAYSADRSWPLFVGIHGAGGSGLECWNLWQTFADREGFILLCPSIPGQPDGFYQNVGETTVWAAVSAVSRDYRTSARIFLSGFSAGASFVQGFAYHYPESVSGISLLSAGNYLPLKSSLRSIPMLVVIGDRDSSMSLQASQKFVNALDAQGFKVQYEILPGVGHRVTAKGRELTIQLFRKTIGK